VRGAGRQGRDTRKLPASQNRTGQILLPSEEGQLIHIVDDQVVASSPVRWAEVVFDIVGVSRISVKIGPVVNRAGEGIGDSKLQSFVEAPLRADLQRVISRVGVIQPHSESSEPAIGRQGGWLYASIKGEELGSYWQLV